MAVIDAGTVPTAVTDTARRERESARPAGVALPSATATTGEASVGRGFVIGSVIGFVAVFALYATISVISGVPTGAAIGVGVFTAFWGGPGFGGMLGAVLAYQHHEDGA